MIYLIDFENVHEEGFSSLGRLGDKDAVYCFFTRNVAKISMSALAGMRSGQLHFVEAESGKQSLDLALVSFLATRRLRDVPGPLQSLAEIAIEKLAVRLADKARKSGRSVRLEPMNPYERKVIHTALQKVDGVTTRSEGEEPYRRVIIEPVR